MAHEAIEGSLWTSPKWGVPTHTHELDCRKAREELNQSTAVASRLEVSGIRTSFVKSLWAKLEEEKSFS